MSEVRKYPKRLIEVDLPIREISEHARREKSANPPGYLSTLHIWWARRPLAACRAVTCAILWPDPADELCPASFRSKAALALQRFADRARSNRAIAELVQAHWSRWNTLRPDPWSGDSAVDLIDLRNTLLHFIADFSQWNAATTAAFLETAHSITAAAHEALGGLEGTRPLVVDPFAGGGTIPLEAMRVGADAFASDLNPVPVILSKVALEHIPNYGSRLAAAVQGWGERVRAAAAEKLARFYPNDADGSTPIAYLWARTVRCEGPECGAEIPLIRSPWLAKKGQRSTALHIIADRDARRVEFEIINKPRAKDVSEGTVRRGAASCPVCGFTTAVERVRLQLRERKGGASDAKLYCVVTTHPARQGRAYRLPTARDLDAVRSAAAQIRVDQEKDPAIVPQDEISLNELRRISVPLYGMSRWGDLFSPRQLLSLTSLAAEVQRARKEIAERESADFATALATCLALVVDRQADALSSLASWRAAAECHRNTFARQALPMVWDFAEVNPFSDASGNWLGAVEWVRKVCEAGSIKWVSKGQAEQCSATAQLLPDDAADAIITDPPYYDAVPYAYLSDFFYVWLRRSLAGAYGSLLQPPQVPKEGEIVVDRPHRLSTSKKDIVFYEQALQRAFADARRVVKPTGISIIVFASKTTASWEAVIRAVVDAGWVITGSWPIDTEREARIAAQGQARLGSSVHLVCRPREVPDGSPAEPVGDWGSVLRELPQRIHEWMPRLAQEGIVGADAIFACLGPALEVFSRYSRVEKVSGELVSLPEYLEQVWAAVSREALAMIFEGADTAGLEPDARLTAMWLWTLAASPPSSAEAEHDGDDQTADRDDDDGAAPPASGASPGFVLEYDAARKIAQGLGAQLEELNHVAVIDGEEARLLPVVERTKYLFGKVEGAPTAKKAAKRKQMALFGEQDQTAEAQSWGEVSAPKAGTTTLDRVHQAMLLFGSGRGEALKRFIVEEGVGKQPQFWKLAQSLSALYPSGTDEKRWVDGVLARKKGLGF